MEFLSLSCCGRRIVSVLDTDFRNYILAIDQLLDSVEDGTVLTNQITIGTQFALTLPRSTLLPLIDILALAEDVEPSAELGDDADTKRLLEVVILLGEPFPEDVIEIGVAPVGTEPVLDQLHTSDESVWIFVALRQLADHFQFEAQ